MKIKSNLTLLLISVLFTACASPQLTGTAGAEWVSNMHRVSAAHIKALSLVSQPKRISSATEREKLRNAAAELAGATAAILEDENAPNSDPLIAHTAAQFAKEVHQANAALEAGDDEWARYSLYRTSAYCISCHTRTDRGAKDFPLQWQLDLTGLNKFQRFDILLANRRYSSALGLGQDLSEDDAAAAQDPSAWLRAVEKALALAVRVNKDPMAAAQIVNGVIKNKSAPHYVRRDAGRWLTDVKAWAREGKAGKTRVTEANAIRLIRQANEDESSDRSDLILNLRASGVLHELFARTAAKDYAEALFLAGMVEESLKDLSAAGTDQSYFERCIYESPHTELSERCFSRLEVLAHAANPYLHLDPGQNYSLRNRIESLREIAEVKDSFENPLWTKRWWEFHEYEKEERRRSRSGQ